MAGKERARDDAIVTTSSSGMINQQEKHWLVSFVSLKRLFSSDSSSFQCF